MDKKGIDPFSLGFSATLYYGVIFFSAPLLAILGVGDWFSESVGVPKNINAIALIYAILGCSSFFIGYRMRILNGAEKRIGAGLRKDWKEERARIVWFVLWFFATAGKIIQIAGGAYRFHVIPTPLEKSPWFSAMGMLSIFGYAALVIAWGMHLRARARGGAGSRIWKYAAWGTFAGEMIYAIPSCNRTSFIVPVIAWCMVLWYGGAIRWKKLVGICAVAVFTALPLGSACRSPEILAPYLGEASGGAGAIGGAARFAAESSLSRLNQFVVFSKIVENIDPLLEEKSLKKFFISLGPPRILWKTKPVISGGSGLGHRLGILHPTVTSTIGPTNMGDWYMNFGLAGVIWGMMALGAVWRFLYECLIKQSGKALSGIMIYAVVWFQVVKGTEDWVSPVYAGLIKSLVILGVLHVALTYGREERKNA